MRRSIVFSSVVVAAFVAAIWILAVAGPAGARAHIICPRERGYVVPPCCPTPPARDAMAAQAICCTNNTQCCQTACCQTACCQTTCCPLTGANCCTPTTCVPPIPTITASPDPSRAGQPVVISGTATSGATVALWRKLAPQSNFQQVSTTTADSSGKYTFTLKRGTVMIDQQWYVTSGRGRSTTLAQQVDAVVGLASSVHSTVVGRPVILRGHVTPSHAGQVVLIEVNHGGAWQVIARPRLGHGSAYSVTHRFAKSGRVKLRAVLGADSRNDRSTSTTLKLTVKR